MGETRKVSLETHNLRSSETSGCLNTLRVKHIGPLMPSFPKKIFFGKEGTISDVTDIACLLTSIL